LSDNNVTWLEFKRIDRVLVMLKVVGAQRLRIEYVGIEVVLGEEM
jgi:hypothetical protein